MTVNAAAIQMQVRCRECNRRLGDFVNELQAGQVILELKCPKCGRPHVEIIRPCPEPPLRVTSIATPRRDSASAARSSVASVADKIQATETDLLFVDSRRLVPELESPAEPGANPDGDA